MDMQIILNYVVLVPLIAVMFLATKYIADYRLNSKIQTTALFVRRSGLYLGVMLGAFAVFENTFIDRTTTELIYHVIVESALVLVFMFTALKIADKVIFGKVCNDTAVLNNNMPIALVEASILVGTGLVAYGSILGTGPIWTSIVFFVIGQIAFVGTVWVYEKVKLKTIDLRHEIFEGSMVEAIHLSSFILIAAMAVKTGVAGDYTGMIPDLLYLAFIFTVMMVSMLYFMFIEKMIFKNSKDELGTAITSSVLRLAYICVTSIALLNTI